MGNDMEMYLEKVLKKNNPEMYIEILEQDREDFAKEIVELNQRIDKAIEYIKFTINHYKEQLETPIEDTYFEKDINRKGYILSIIAYLQTTLDILQGSDKE